ncbi:MAG TPA: hypothetical protein VIS99_04910 [Terrimicrobiaceae bacterium]
MLSVVLLVLLLGGSFFLYRYLGDPLRTLEQFPVAKYLEDYKPLTGSKFRGNLRVENDLGWKEGIGRLMVFTFAGIDSRAVVVLVPANLAHLYFAKGQTYEGEFEVKEGGLICANLIRKN